MNPLLIIDQIGKRFGSLDVLKDIQLEVDQGEFIALLGPSGCGKTTLLRTIAGFLEPDRGRILIDGSDVVRLPPNRRPLNTVFQNYALFPHMRVIENVAYGPSRAGVNRGEAEKRAAEALAMVDMATFGQRYPRELSGGQQQRVALARAIVNRPRLLLLDEPLSALDLQLRKKMQLELKHLQAALGITFIFVTHDQQEALTMADRIVVMNAGRIEQVGMGSEIYKRPATKFTAEFIGEANFMKFVRCANNTARLDLCEQIVVCSGTVPDRGDAVLRPESIRVVHSSHELPKTWCRLPARIDEVVNLGSHELVYATVGHRLLVVRAPVGCAAQIKDLASEVAFDPQDLHLIAEV